MNLFLYLNKNTYMHRLDPRTKIIVMLISFVIGVLLGSPVSLLVFSLFVLIYGATGGTLENLKRIWFILFTIAIFTTLIWSVFAKGTTPLFWRVTYESLIYGLAMAIKVDILVVCGMIFLSSSKIEEISLGLIKMGLPYQVAFAFSTAIRLVPTIIGNCYTIIEAQKSRGLDTEKGNFLEKIKKFIPLLIPVFLSTIRSTNTFAMALESKGFGSEKGRSSILHISFHRLDYILLTVAGLSLALTIFLRILGFGVVKGLVL